jgi:hypothetical protein
MTPQAEHLKLLIDAAGRGAARAKEAWECDQWDSGTLYLGRVLQGSDVGQIGVILDEFIGYCVQLLEGIGGVERFTR